MGLIDSFVNGHLLEPIQKQRNGLFILGALKERQQLLDQLFKIIMDFRQKQRGDENLLSLNTLN